MAGDEALDAAPQSFRSLNARRRRGYAGGHKARDVNCFAAGAVFDLMPARRASATTMDPGSALRTAGSRDNSAIASETSTVSA